MPVDTFTEGDCYLLVVEAMLCGFLGDDEPAFVLLFHEGDFYCFFLKWVWLVIVGSRFTLHLAHQDFVNIAFGETRELGLQKIFLELTDLSPDVVGDVYIPEMVACLVVNPAFSGDNVCELIGRVGLVFLVVHCDWF